MLTAAQLIKATTKDKSNLGSLNKRVAELKASICNVPGTNNSNISQLVTTLFIEQYKYIGNIMKSINN